MRIGIITLFDNGNMGAALQAYALNAVLRQMGCVCEDIRYERVCDGQSDAQANRKKRREMLRSFKGCAAFATKAVCRLALRNKMAKRRQRFSDFLKQNIPQTQRAFRGVEALKGAELPYDMFICGSDNIWNKHKLDPAYFLAFVPEGVPKYSYAAGLSATGFSEKERECILPLVERLDAVSVRDGVGVRLLHSMTDKPIREDVDPTLLLSQDEWLKMAKPVQGLPKEYIFCYLLGNAPEGRRAAQILKKRTGLAIVNIPHATSFQGNDIGFGNHRLYDVGPAEYLSLISGASYVITDSFHGCVFSLIFEKQFVALRRFPKGPEFDLNMRLDCLLDNADLHGRIASDPGEAVCVLQDEIDYGAARQALSIRRGASMDYLRSIIEHTEKERG